MNIKSLFSNRRIVVGAIIALIVAAGIIGGTIAYFQDVETSVGNRFVAGKFNLKIDNTCHYNGEVCTCVGTNGAPPCYWNGTPQTPENQCFCTWELKDLAGELYFNFLDVKPGDFGEDTISLHVDNNDAWICAEVANLVKDDNGCEKPESDVDTSCGAGQGELQDNLLFSIFRDYNCDNIKNGNDFYVVQNQPAQAGYWPIADSQHGPAISGGTTICYGVKWNVPLATTNIIQTDSLLGNVIFTAVQSRHMDTFICSAAGPCVPQTEICDGQDNDCNPATVDGSQDPQLGTPCDGPDSDLCSEGAYMCSGGALVCSDMTGSTVDICDGVDNDCDPASADGSEDPLVGTACDGPDADLCMEGTRSCSAGVLTCSDNTGGNPDICDGVDNDCDGQVDEDGASLCNDGLYCNGTETCAAGICVHAGNPCPGPDGDGDCSESCNEASDNCTANDPAASACNDGLYCNGTDMCNGTGSCVIYAGDPCPGPDGDLDCSESCNETLDNCTVNDPNGSACNGGLCQMGSCIY